MQYLRQNSGTGSASGVTIPIGPCLDADGAEYTGLLIGDLTLVKNGTAAAMAANATLTHVDNGRYTLVTIGNNADTLGRAEIFCNKDGYQIPTKEFMVLPAASYDAVVTNGLNNLSQANVRTALGMASADLDTQLDAIAAGVATSTAPTREPIIAISASADGNITRTTAKNTTGKRFIRCAVSTLATASQSDATPYDNYNNEYEYVDMDEWDLSNPGDPDSGGVRHWVFECVNPATGPGHVLSVSTSSKSPAIAVAFLDDILVPDATDKASTAVPSSGTSTQGGAITPSENGSYCLSFIGLGVTTAPTCSGVDSYLAVGVNALGNNIGVGVAVYRQATAASFNPTWTHQSTQRIGRNYSFKPAVVDTAVVYANQFPAGYTEKVEQTEGEWLSGETEISCAFAYHEQTPAKIRIEWYEAGTTEVVKSFTDLTDLIVGDRVAVGKTTAPAGGPWNFKLRTLDAQNNILATSEQTSYDYYVGLRVGVGLQSNGQRMFDNYAGISEVALAGTIMYSADGWAAFTAGAPIIRLANQLRETSGLPVALFKIAVPGSAVTADPGNGSGYWLDRGATSPFGKMQIMMAAPKPRFNALVMIGGEADTLLEASGDTWQAGIIELSNRFNQLDDTVVKFIMPNLGKLDDYDADVLTELRNRQASMPDVRPHIFHGGNPIDGTLADADPYHRNGVSYVRDCNRISQGTLFALGFSEVSARGPQALHAWYYLGGSTIYLNTTATALTQPTSGVPTGIDIEQDGDELTLESVTYSGGVIEFHVEEELTNDALTIDFCTGKTPVTTRLIYGTDLPGNDTIGMPLLPFAGMVAEMRSAKSADDLVTKAELPLYPGVGSVGYTLKGRDGALVQARTDETVSIVAVNERERTATYAAYCDQPSGLADGIAQWDNGETVAVDRLVDSRFNLIDEAVSDIDGGGGGTPPAVLQRIVSPNRILQVKDRGDGTYGVVGDGMNVIAGEPKQLWALEFKGTQLPAGQNLFSMSEPEVVGDDAADATIGTDDGTTYGVQLTRAAYEFRVASDAEAGADIEAKITVQFTSSGDGIDVYVPVNVKAAEE